MVVNMTERIIDKEIKLFPYYRNDDRKTDGWVLGVKRYTKI